MVLTDDVWPKREKFKDAVSAAYRLGAKNLTFCCDGGARGGEKQTSHSDINSLTLDLLRCRKVPRSPKAITRPRRFLTQNQAANGSMHGTFDITLLFQIRQCYEVGYANIMFCIF